MENNVVDWWKEDIKENQEMRAVLVVHKKSWIIPGLQFFFSLLQTQNNTGGELQNKTVNL